MRRQKRPYFTLIVFLTLLAFGLFLAWQSRVLSQELAESIPLRAGGRTLYLPVLGGPPCSPAPCPPPAAPAYPARLETEGNLLASASFWFTALPASWRLK